MKNNRRYALLSKLLLAILLVVGINTQLSARQNGIPDNEHLSVMTGSGLFVGASTFQEYAAVSINQNDVFIQNIITVKVLEETNLLIPANFTATVKVKIEYGPNASNLSVLDDQVFTVDYNKDPRAKYNAQKYLHFSGAKYVRVTIKEVTPGAVGSIDIQNLIQVENEMRIVRFYELKDNAIISSFNKESFTAGNDELGVNWVWPIGTGNNYTQLEWTWLDEDMVDNYKVNGTVSPYLVFKNNATRIDLPVNITSYRIPLLYGVGTLYCRIRAVNIMKNGSRSDGPWSSALTQAFAGHNDKLNWQASISFAEEGKRKAVVQYFDGSLRSRQTVTKDNVTNTIISAETFYDHQGRPAVQILPVPGITNTIAYTKNLNLFNTQVVDTDPGDIFDLEPITVVDPTIPLSATKPLSSSGGAAKYYSSSNPDKNTGFNKSIPDAEGFPYSITRYMPDGTGRVMAQSGVGSTFQMGSGHETKYYYATAAQEELDGLFGTEVGNHTHYTKNVVKDANGQMSVSYVDMLGRTIATALAGSAPSNLVPLTLDNTNYPNQSGSVLERNLLNANTNIVKNNSIESITSIVVPVTTNYQFSYSLTPSSLTLPACPENSGLTVCYDCMYDLEISITDESGERATVVKKYNNIKLDADDNCNTAVALFKENGITGGTGSNTISFTESLLPGSYAIRKTLTMSEASLQLQKEAYLQKALCKTEQQIIDSIYSILVTTTGCNTPQTQTPCEACLAERGEYGPYKINYLTAIGQPTNSTAYDAEILAAFNAATEHCTKLCATTSQALPSTRQMMLTDMMPFGGQYAKDPATAASSTSYNKYDIFSTLNGGLPFYKRPVYLNTLGETDIINQTLSTTTPQDFASAFNYEWAELLLPYHPEYAKLTYAENNLTESYNWIATFNEVATFSEAETKGYILYDGTYTSTPYNDPFYTKATSYLNGMAQKVTNIYANKDDVKLSLWQLAYGEARCKTLLTVEGQRDCYMKAPKQPTLSPIAPFDNLTTEEKDKIWVLFRTLYANERGRELNQFINEQVPLSDADNLVAANYILHYPTEAQMVTQYGNDNDDWAWWPSTPGAEPDVPADYGNTTATAQYQSRCEGYIDSWKAALSQCPVLNTHEDKEEILTTIVNQMKEVCKKGSDNANPDGASSVAPNTPNDNTPRSFEEIIYAVFATYHIDITNVCNPYIIEFPKPYGKSPKFTNNQVNSLDSCNCTKFAQLKADALAKGYTPTSFSSLNQYFRNTFNDTITLALYNAFSNCSTLGMQISCRTVYDTLYYDCSGANPCNVGGNLRTSAVVQTNSTPVEECPEGYHWDAQLQTCVEDNTSGECPEGEHWDYDLQACVPDAVENPNEPCMALCPKWKCDTVGKYTIVLSTPLAFPDFLNCGGTTSRCITCADLSAKTTLFKNTFTATYNSAPNMGTALSADQLASNVLWAKFLNYHTGFQYSWFDYAKAANAANCDLASYASNTLATQTVLCADTLALVDTTGVFLNEPVCQKAYNMASSLGQNVYQTRRQVLLSEFEAQFREKCMAAKDLESFTVTYTNKEYHFTLYYYDLAGNLVKTVPPKGARPNFEKSFLDAVKAARQGNTSLKIIHLMPTEYRYNSLNQVIAQLSPDAGLSEFWYDKLGRLAVSQNEEQSIANKHSYTLYDKLGRITEVGQKLQPISDMAQTISQDEEALNSWINTSGGLKEQITFTVYDLPYVFEDDTYLTQRNLRSRVSYTAVKKLSTDAAHYTASFYTYDVHGNVDTLLQDYRGIPVLGDMRQRFKKIAYDYDLISGKVNMVSYQHGESDAFYHKYLYDAENKLTEVSTSRDSVLWEREGAYYYYKHGPLARTIVGQQQVQGTDYAYTLQGWLKGVNTTNVGVGGFDIGKDGLPSTYSPVAKDVLGFALHYYDTSFTGASWIDYKPIAGVSAFARPAVGSNFTSLYNGNIGAISTNNWALNKGEASSTNALPLFYNYRYDQLNRIVNLQAYRGLNTAGNEWTPVSIDDFKESVTYDPNGNILTYNRNGLKSGTNPALIDALTYHYEANQNKLLYVSDAVANSPYTGDIENQLAGNYEYDAIGNLVKDNSEGLVGPGATRGISWTVYGKIESIIKGGITITYTYDAAGNRITKESNGKITIYVRDAAGNVMSIYERASEGSLVQKELHIYGSSRLGLTTALTVSPTSVPLEGGLDPATLSTFTRGEKNFELNNHLGNVLATVSDKKIQRSDNNTTLSYYDADVLTASDYYPFGMIMPGRNIVTTGCPEEIQDAMELKASSDLQSGVTQNSDKFIQNGVTWQPQAATVLSYSNQAIRVDNIGPATGSGVLVYVPLTQVEPFTTYIMECDIPEFSAGITGFNIQAISQTGDTYRVSTQQTGTGHHSVIFTTGASNGTYLAFRIVSRANSTGLYYVVDNFTFKKYTVPNPTQKHATDFNTAVKIGVNIDDNGQLWTPINSTTNTVSLTEGTDKKIAVNCTTQENSRLRTEFPIASGKNYLVKFKMGQDLADKRLILQLWSRTGTGTWTVTESGSVLFVGSGDYQFNFTAPAGVDQLRVEFLRTSTGNSFDGLDVPYTIDNFSLILMEPQATKKVSVCTSPANEEKVLYRYGFNGKENDNEVKGEGNQQDYGMRVYDPRLGKFLSVDPLTSGYPSWSPYPFAMNRPIDGVDLDGMEWMSTKDKEGTVTGYTWSGYNRDGTPVDGTVSNASVFNKDKGYHVFYNSDQRTRSGSATYMSQGSEEGYRQGIMVKNNFVKNQYNVNVNYSDNWVKAGLNYRKETTVYAELWNENTSKSTGTQIFNTGMGTPSTVFNNPKKFFNSIRYSLGYADGPSSQGIESFNWELYVMPFPKGLGLMASAEGAWMGGVTVLGSDAATALNASRMVSESGLHQVLLHGTPDGFMVNGSFTTAKQLARSILQSGFKKGTTIRLISCHTGVFADGAAYQLSRYLKSRVIAPTNKVRILDGGGYEIFGGGRFRTFFNTTIQ